MAFLKDIRTKIGEFLMLRQSAHLSRARTIMNIDSAKRFGITYLADKPEDVELVKKYSDTLRISGKNVTTLGLLNVKEIPLGLNGSMQHQYFSFKEMNWYFKPSSHFIDNFVKEDFDILLNFDISWQLPVTFINSLSMAKCKVGRYSEKYEKLYDVMIEVPEKQNPEINSGQVLEYFIKNTYTYMQMLNK